MYFSPISQKTRYQFRHMIASRYQLQDGKKAFCLPWYIYCTTKYDCYPWLFSLCCSPLAFALYIVHCTLSDLEWDIQIIFWWFFWISSYVCFAFITNGIGVWSTLKSWFGFKRPYLFLREWLSPVHNRLSLIVCYFCNFFSFL